MSLCKGCNSKEAVNLLKEELSKIFVDESVQEKRLALCYECEKYIATSIQCGECGCYLFAKTAEAGESCPLPEPKW